MHRDRLVVLAEILERAADLVEQRNLHGGGVGQLTLHRFLRTPQEGAGRDVGSVRAQRIGVLYAVDQEARDRQCPVPGRLALLNLRGEGNQQRQGQKDRGQYQRGDPLLSPDELAQPIERARGWAVIGRSSKVRRTSSESCAADS